MKVQIEQLNSFIQTRLDHLQTEEATKTAIVLPFIDRVLGYSPYDPHDVIPEFIADVGMKKGEKVDYALFQNDKPVILVEVKQHNVELGELHIAQLYRYYSCIHPDFTILTNGLRWMFFTDLEKKNCMDSEPFMDFTLSEVSKADQNVLYALCKSTYDPKKVFSLAKTLTVGSTNKIIAALEAEMMNASDSFLQIIYDSINPRRLGKRRPGLSESEKDTMRSVIRRTYCKEPEEDEGIETLPKRKRSENLPNFEKEDIVRAIASVLPNVNQLERPTIGKVYTQVVDMLGFTDRDPTGNNLYQQCLKKGWKFLQFDDKRKLILVEDNSS